MYANSRRAALEAIDKAGKVTTLHLDHLQQTHEGIPIDLDGCLMDPDATALAYRRHHPEAVTVKANWRL